MYFDAYVTRAKFTENSASHHSAQAEADSGVELTAVGDAKGSSGVGVGAALPVFAVSSSTAKGAGVVSESAEAASRRLGRPYAEEILDMRAVPWTSEPNPEGRASIFSRVTLTWMTPLFFHAHKHNLEEKDIWDLRAQFRSIDNFKHFEAIFLQEKAKGVPHPLRSAMLRCFGWYFLTAAPLLAIQNVSQLALPFLLGPLIKFMGNGEPVVNGYLYSIGFFIALMIMTFAENQYFDRCVKTGATVRASFIPTIFRHSLRMSNSARQDRSIGMIVNHMAGDTDKVVSNCLSLHNLWSNPMRLALGVWMLVSILGVAGIFGILSVVVVIPVQTWCMKTGAAAAKDVMNASDVRVKILNEVLNGMRVIKYYAWEKPFQIRVKEMREKELEKLSTANNYRAINMFFTNFNPVAMAVGTFVAFALLQGNLEPYQAFQALTLFGQMLWPLMLFPRSLSEFMETLTSIDRIESYLLSSTIADSLTLGDDGSTLFDAAGVAVSASAGAGAGAPGQGTFSRIVNGPVEVAVADGCYSWAEGAQPTLVGVNLKIEPGQLVAIVGTTGCGKSSLMSALLGEMVMTNGAAKLIGSVAYAPQQAWIFNATVRENITFGLDWDEAKYNAAIDSSCLRSDIDKQFAAGDLTEIGEKGINLSGGQRQRVNIARALYSDAQVYMFDDPLSALDAHVAADVFRVGIKGALAGKTRLLVTNQLHLMPEMDRIICVKNGRIVEDGTFRQLMGAQGGGEFKRLFDELGQVVKEEVGADEVESQTSVAIVGEPAPATRNDESERSETDAAAALPPVAPAAATEQSVSVPPPPPPPPHSAAAPAPPLKGKAPPDLAPTAGKLVQKETHSTGYIQNDVYLGYFRSVGFVATAIMLGATAFSIGANLATSMWLVEWTRGAASAHPKPVGFYIGIYVALSIAQVVLTFGGNYAGFAGSVVASRNLHADFVRGLMSAPISFFDTTPLGRITNRMSKDMGSIDNTIMTVVQMVARAVLGLVGTLIIIGINTTYVLVPFVPILMLFAGVQNFYRSTAVQLRRLDAVSRSPIYSHFQESLGGIATIRAYNAQGRMSLVNALRLDQNQRIYLMSVTSNRWLSIRLEFLGGLLILVTAFNCVILRGRMTPSSAGISLSYALQITAQLNLLIRVVTEVEASFNAVERVQEYTRIEPEAARESASPPPPSWPSEGAVEVRDLLMSYRPGQPPVLNGLSFSIQPSQKIGVCGRTGAGKSSLFQALFRMMEPTAGSMKFDGVDICALGLDDVRNAISIIPQEPVLFSGSLRFNLDPFDLYTDVELWEALSKASLKEMLIVKGEKLGMKVAEGGENFSVGQRQLVCLARALLRKSKILVLDEATANVDIETDALIQRTIRENFADRTTLTIAHRLNTIIDCDKILVLELGRVKEFDSPLALLSNPSSEFSSMVRETGPENEASLKAAVGIFSGEGSAASDRSQSTRRQQEQLVLSAKEKLAAMATMGGGGGSFALGPLMRGVRDAASTFRLGWDDRHSPAWEQELAERGVSLAQWMGRMSELLSSVNTAAALALDSEHMDFKIGDGIFQSDNANGHHLQITSHH